METSWDGTVGGSYEDTPEDDRQVGLIFRQGVSCQAPSDCAVCSRLSSSPRLTGPRRRGGAASCRACGGCAPPGAPAAGAAAGVAARAALRAAGGMSTRRWWCLGCGCGLAAWLQPPQHAVLRCTAATGCTAPRRVQSLRPCHAPVRDAPPSLLAMLCFVLLLV